MPEIFSKKWLLTDKPLVVADDLMTVIVSSTVTAVEEIWLIIIMPLLENDSNIR